MDPAVNSPPVVSRRPLFILVAILLLFTLLILGFFYLRSRKGSNFVSGFVSDPGTSLASTAGRTNLVFLGIGGENHEAGDLTDSMIFLSLSHADSSLAIMSLPRDIWVDTMAAKINTAYHYGSTRREGGGLDLAKSAVAEVTGQPIHYALALDFEGFVAAIDAVGGIDVIVTQAFDDYKYPIPGQEDAEPESARYEHLHFDAGPTHMDGTTALKFARSRHAEGDEGTDFARSARQQLIIMAFKDKLLASQTLLNLETLKNIYNSFQSSVDTDIKEGEFGSFFRFFLKYQQANTPSLSLSIDDYLVNPLNRSSYQGQWVLIPEQNWAAIHDYVAQTLAQ